MDREGLLVMTDGPGACCGNVQVRESVRDQRGERSGSPVNPEYLAGYKLLSTRTSFRAKKGRPFGPRESCSYIRHGRDRRFPVSFRKDREGNTRIFVGVGGVSAAVQIFYVAELLRH